MTQREVREGSVVDLVARIARERSQDAADVRDETDDVVSVDREQHAPRWRPPTRLFPGAPKRRPRTP
jgi:hypothetical protein